MGRVSPEGLLLKPPRYQILLKFCWLSAWETVSEHAQFMNANQPNLTTSFEPITSQDYNNRTPYFPSAHKSYIHPAEFLKRGLVHMFRTPGSRTEPLSPWEAAAGAAAEGAALLPSCGRDAAVPGWTGPGPGSDRPAGLGRFQQRYARADFHIEVFQAEQI